jgi:flagellar hook-associated protein 3 FlgL
MRVSDLEMSQTYIQNYNNINSQLDTLQTQISTGNNIQEPSDNPSGTASLIEWNSQLDQSKAYSSNITNASSFVADTTTTMQSIQTDVSGLLTTLNNLSNTTSSGDYSTDAQQIQGTLSDILSLANTQSNGKYVFGGTDDSTAPYGYSADGSSIEVKSSGVSGAQVIKTSGSTSQQINMSGTQVFGTIVNQNGNIDPTTSIGDSVSDQSTVYDTSGNAYTLKVNYTKIAADTYSMTYDVLNSNNTSVLASPPAAQTLVFNSSTGNLQTVDGSTPSQITVNVPGSNINFNLDQSSITEKSGTSSLNLSENQQTDIFNTLISIVNSLKAGTAPTAAQTQAVSDFNDRLLNNIAETGNVTNQLTNTGTLLSSQQTQLSNLISNVQTVNAAKSATELSNLNYILDATYDMASKIMDNYTLLDILS